MRTELPLSFAPRDYFRRLIHLMVNEWLYEFVAWVSIDTVRDVPYHVPCKGARSSRLFFRVPGRAVMVMAEFNERVEDFERWFGTEIPQSPDDRGYRHHWAISLYWEMGEVGLQRWIDQTQQPGIHSCELPDPEIQTPDGFQFSSCAMNWKYEQEPSCFFCPGRRTFPADIASAIGTLIATPRLAAADKFSEMLVTGFAPHYTFPGCEPTFVRLFPWKRLRRFVARPYGLPFGKQDTILCR